jgi:hypothetical protein
MKARVNGNERIGEMMDEINFDKRNVGLLKFP